jgi:hypothetical protein
MKHPGLTLSPAEELRILGGLVVQPFVAAGLAYVMFPLLLLDRDGQTLAGGFPADVADAALSVAMGAGIVAGVVVLVGVLPVAVWLMKRRDLTLKKTLMFGLGFGNFPYVLLGVAAGDTYGVTGLLRGVTFSSLMGLVGAALFWLISVHPQTVHGTEAAG